MSDQYFPPNPGSGGDDRRGDATHHGYAPPPQGPASYVGPAATNQAWAPPGAPPTGWPPPGSGSASWQDLPTGPIPVVAAGPGPGTPNAPGRGRRPRLSALITAAVVVLALLVGGGIFFFAHRSSQSAGGKDSPQEAASAFLASFTQKDPVGVADQLDPSEAALFSDLSGDGMTHLKRLGIVDQSTSPTSTSGSTVKVENLTYGPTPQVVNDHLQLVTVTAGTITLTSDPAQLPFTSKIKSAMGTQLAQQKAQTRVYDLANQTKRLGHPIQIATVKRGDKWYPSLFYSAANLVAQEQHLGTPTSSIPAQGSASPEAAMDALLGAVSAGDLSKAIAITSPDEMGVLHDYGPMLLANHPAKATGMQFSGEQWNVTDVTGGKLVSLKALTVNAGGKAVTVTRDVAGNSLTVTVPGHPAVVLNDSTIDSFLNSDTLTGLGFWGRSSTCLETSDSSGFSASNGCSTDTAKTPVLDATTEDIIKREFHQVLQLGVVMTQSGGSWYVSPLRSYSNVLVTLLKGLQPSDIDYLLAKIGK